MRWAAKRAEYIGAKYGNASLHEAREAIKGFVNSAQLRASAERLTGNATHIAQHEAYVAAEEAAALLEKAQHHSAKAHEKNILAAHLRLIVAVEELDDDGGASASTDAPLTFATFRPSRTRRNGSNALSYRDAS